MKDPILLHELLHAASIAADLIERIGDAETYAPLYNAHPEVRAAYDRAVDAAWEFYQAAGRAIVAETEPAQDP